MWVACSFDPLFQRWQNKRNVIGTKVEIALSLGHYEYEALRSGFGIPSEAGNEAIPQGTLNKLSGNHLLLQI